MIAKIIGVFIAYMGSILIFSILYFWKYNDSPDSFLFSSDIASGQMKVVSQRREQEITLLTRCSEALADLRHSIAAGASPFSSRKIAHTETWTAKIGENAEVKYLRVTSGKGYNSGAVYISGMGGEPIPRLKWKLFQDKNHLHQRVSDAHDHINSKLERKSSENIRGTEARIWGYVDFLYFSTITQTTVGYGDMLPNSSIIRGMVCMQIMIGYFILVILLAIFTASGGG